MQEVYLSSFILYAIIFVIFFNSVANANRPNLKNYGFIEGDLISSNIYDGDPDVYIINEHGFKRLLVNEKIFNKYKHLSFDKIKSIQPITKEKFITSGLFRNCEINSSKVWALEVISDDNATLHHVDLKGYKVLEQDPEFFNKVFCINSLEEELYTKSTPYTSLNQIQDYMRSTITLPPMSHKSLSIPMGIFALDSKNGIYRDANIRTYPFVKGYAWRTGWADLESSKNMYDFSAVDHIINQLNAVDKKLSLHLISTTNGTEPGYLVSEPGTIMWLYTVDEPTTRVVSKPVPWDPNTMLRYKLFIEALATHTVRLSNNSEIMIPLKDHPLLEHIIITIPGIGSVREGSASASAPEIADLPDYKREKFLEAVMNSIEATKIAFPNTTISVPFWAVTDNIHNPEELWEYIQNSINTTYNQDIKRVGFFNENLAASEHMLGSVKGTPVVAFAKALYSAKNIAFTTFQMLQSWARPFSDPRKTENTTPVDAIQFAFDTYNTKYFEVYVLDLDNTEWHPLFNQWAKKLSQ